MVSFIKVLHKMYVSTEPVKMMPQAETLLVFMLSVLQTPGETVMTADIFTPTLQINIEQWAGTDLWFWLGFLVYLL